MRTAPLLPIKSELEDSFKNPVSPYYCGIDVGRSLDVLLVYPKSPGYSYDLDSFIRTQERLCTCTYFCSQNTGHVHKLTNFADVKVETMRTLLKYYMAWIKCVAVAIMKNRNRCDINVNGIFAINYQIMLLLMIDNRLSHCISLTIPLYRSNKY